ncbi:hypothetical protein CSUB01_05049 [Colletotrichum sublineola]|uniref:Uncharacterized protein n=1 Tax=Colletotrichum sublineola TaxID=1173701 RepID=A0A066X2R9_COLSU|nr:hypothetical protein CSUB01_05049 [Colletotrichum sublineola]
MAGLRLVGPPKVPPPKQTIGMHAIRFNTVSPLPPYISPPHKFAQAHYQIAPPPPQACSLCSIYLCPTRTQPSPEQADRALPTPSRRGSDAVELALVVSLPAPVFDFEGPQQVDVLYPVICCCMPARRYPRLPPSQSQSPSPRTDSTLERNRPSTSGSTTTTTTTTTTCAAATATAATAIATAAPSPLHTPEGRPSCLVLTHPHRTAPHRTAPHCTALHYRTPTQPNPTHQGAHHSSSSLTSHTFHQHTFLAFPLLHHHHHHHHYLARYLGTLLFLHPLLSEP